jgi:hypothetical protein
LKAGFNFGGRPRPTKYWPHRVWRGHKERSRWSEAQLRPSRSPAYDCPTIAPTGSSQMRNASTSVWGSSGISIGLLAIQSSYSGRPNCAIASWLSCGADRWCPCNSRQAPRWSRKLGVKAEALAVLRCVSRSSDFPEKCLLMFSPAGNLGSSARHRPHRRRFLSTQCTQYLVLRNC